MTYAEIEYVKNKVYLFLSGGQEDIENALEFYKASWKNAKINSIEQGKEYITAVFEFPKPQEEWKYTVLEMGGYSLFVIDGGKNKVKKEGDLIAQYARVISDITVPYKGLYRRIIFID